jgi:hypothetical protein
MLIFLVSTLELGISSLCQDTTSCFSDSLCHICYLMQMRFFLFFEGTRYSNFILQCSRISISALVDQADVGFFCCPHK